MLARPDLQKIAQSKLDDALLLFQSRRYSNAYYLFGYAAEIALKARLARAFASEVIPDRRFVERIYQHDLNALASLAGLKPELDAARAGSHRFDGFWSTVSDWSPQCRYDSVDQFTCIGMHTAMCDTQDGVFPWLRHRW